MKRCRHSWRPRSTTTPVAALPHLFDRFYQASRPGRRAGPEGLGVGLYITRELVRAHGGAIAVRSYEGEGATFTVRLPLLTAPEAAGPTSTPEASVGGGTQ